MTTPSTGIFSPGRTMTTSPTCTSSTGTSTSLPSRSTRAVFAFSPRSLRMASEVWPFARASSSRPSRMSAMIMVDVSKYVAGIWPPIMTRCGPEGRYDAVQVGGARAHGDEHVHVGRAVLQRGPRALVEPPADPELDRAWPAGKRTDRPDSPRKAEVDSVPSLAL